jgi:hypothetical protein
LAVLNEKRTIELKSCKLCAAIQLQIMGLHSGVETLGDCRVEQGVGSYPAATILARLIADGVKLRCMSLGCYVESLSLNGNYNREVRPLMILKLDY